MVYTHKISQQQLNKFLLIGLDICTGVRTNNKLDEMKLSIGFLTLLRYSFFSSFLFPISRITTPYSLLPTPYSLFPIPYSLLPKTRYSFFLLFYSLLSTPYSLLPTPYFLKQVNFLPHLEMGIAINFLVRFIN